MDQPNPAIHNGGGGHIYNDQQQQQQMDMLNGLQQQMANQQQQPNNYMPHPDGPPQQQQPYWPMGHNEMPSTSTAANGYGGNRMVNGGVRPMGHGFLPNPHYFPSPEQMSMPGAVSSPSVSSSDQQYQGMPGGPAGSPLKNGVPFSPTYNHTTMVNGGARNAFVFSTEMANRAMTEVRNQRYESMVHWHMANAGGAVQPSTSAASAMGMPCRSPLDGAYGVVGSPSPAGLAPGTNGRGTKRKASANMTNPDQHQSPSPHHLPVLSNGKPMQHMVDNNPCSVPDAAIMAGATVNNPNKMNGMMGQSTACDFLRPPNASSVGGHYPPSQDDDNPLKRIEAMTKLCDPTPNNNGNKMSRIASNTDLPNAEATPAQSKEEKLAKLEAINKFMSITPNLYNEANNPGMRRPPFCFPPGMHPGPDGLMPSNQPPFNPQLAAMMHQQRQQQAAFYGGQQPNGMPWNGGGPPGGPQMVIGPNGPMPASHSPSFNPLNQPNGQMMMAGGMPQQPHFPGGQGMPAGPAGQMFSPAQMAAMQQHHMRMAQPNQHNFQPDMRPGAESNYWPGQQHMPQPLANLDTRVPVQKMQYFPNSQIGQPQQSMAGGVPQ